MAIRNILIYPDPRLRRKSAPVGKIESRHLRLLDDMAETMYEAKGVGLAAPQVGVNERLIVVDVTQREEGEGGGDGSPGLIELINPEIVLAEGEMVGEEGCLSVPGFVCDVKRSARVVVRGLDKYGVEVEIDASDLLSRVLQHEIDHLDGILFFDRLSRLKRELMVKRIDRAFAAA